MKYIIAIILLITSILSIIKWGISLSSILVIVTSILIITLFMKLKFMNITIRKIYKVLVGVYLISFIIIEIVIIVNSEIYDNIENTQNIDTVIVLGARTDGYDISDTLRLRLDEAINYYNKNQSVNIIVSGGIGKGETISEASAMKKYLVENSVKSNNIIKENRAKTTLENIVYSIDIIEKLDLSKEVMIVTSDYHLFRAMTIGEILGLDTSGLCYESSISNKLYYMVREYPSVIIDLFRSIYEAIR